MKQRNINHWSIKLSLILCFFTPLHSFAIKPLDQIIAVVNDDVITQNELESRVADYASQLKLSNSASPELTALTKQVLERMIRNRIQLQLASQMGIKIDDIALNRVLEQLSSSNNMTLDQLKAKLEKGNIEFSRFREQTRNELIIKQLQQRAVANKVNVSDQEISQFIEQNLKQKSENTKYHLLHILVATPESATPDDIIVGKQKAAEIYTEILNGADFKDQAIKKSNGRNALKGGDLGWRKASELPKDFVAAVRNLNKGDTSQPIRSASGYHILQLVDKSDNQQVVTQTHARHILIRTSSDRSDDEAKALLSQLKKRIDSGEDFAQLASENSQDPGSKIKGGDLGWADPGSFVTEFEDVMDKLEDGQISEPFRSQFGWHLLQVLERREQDKTQTNIEAQARKSIRKRKIDEELRLWLRRIREEAYVEYTDKTLSNNK
jgi:peptidyl-prolyl cis-trans isomerase SurA